MTANLMAGVIILFCSNVYAQGAYLPKPLFMTPAFLKKCSIALESGNLDMNKSDVPKVVDLVSCTSFIWGAVNTNFYIGKILHKKAYCIPKYTSINTLTEKFVSYYKVHPKEAEQYPPAFAIINAFNKIYPCGQQLS